MIKRLFFVHVLKPYVIGGTQNQGISSSGGNDNDEEPENQITPKFMLHPRSKWMFRIKMIRLLMKGYIAVIIPFRIPFEEKPHPFWLACDCILNVMLIIDIFFHF